MDTYLEWFLLVLAFALGGIFTDFYWTRVRTDAEAAAHFSRDNTRANVRSYAGIGKGLGIGLLVLLVLLLLSTACTPLENAVQTLDRPIIPTEAEVVETDVTETEVVETDVTKTEVVETDVTETEVVETDVTKTEVVETETEIVEVAVDWEEGAFGDTLFDENMNPTMVLEPGHGAIFTSDPADYYVNGIFIFGGKGSNQGLVTHIQNDSNEAITIRVDVGYYNPTWRRPNGEQGRWGVHVVEYKGTFAKVEELADELQFTENKPLYYTARITGELITEPTAQATSVPTAQATSAPTAQATSVPTQVCTKFSGTGPVWISSDPATVNGTQISTRFTLIVASGSSYNISGVSEQNMSLVCNPDSSYMSNYDNAPTRVEIDKDGNVNVTTP